MAKTRHIALLCISILLIASPALAGLTVLGSIYEGEVKPGEHVTHNMVISTDPGDRPMELQVDVLGFKRDLRGQNVELSPEEDTGPYTARPFLNASPRNFSISPGGSQTVLLEGDIPVDIGDGGRYALVFIHSNPGGSGNIGIAVGVEVPVRLTIAGTKLIKTGEITSLKLNEPISRERQNSSLIFNNTGNYHYQAFAEAILKDKNGNVLSNASTPLTFSSIIPTTSRQFDLSLSPTKGLQSGSYILNSTVRLEDGTALASKEVEFRIP